MTIRIEWNSMKASELSGNNLRRHHPMMRHRKEQQLLNDTIAMLKDMELSPWSPMQQVRIKFIAYYCGKPLDPDNLIAGMKYAVDGVVAAGVIPDDGPAHLLGFDVEYHKMHRMKDRRLAMEITEVK